MRSALTIVGCVLVSASVAKPVGAHAQEPNDGYTVFGMGNDSCATVYQAKNADVAEAWVFGYFSALNVINRHDHNVASSAGADRIMGELKRICDTNPFEPFFNAASAAYLKLQQEER
jgi:hypothetical protein